MKLKYKEDPKEWRKSALLTLGGLALISSLLRWRHVFTTKNWCAILAALVVAAILACLQPRWFRGYYRLSLWLGFYLSQFIGRIILFIFFILIVTPLGFILRLTGKDPLQLKHPRDAQTYWQPARDAGSLDRLF